MIGYSVVAVLVFLVTMIGLRWHERRTYRDLNDWVWIWIIATLAGVVWPVTLPSALLAVLGWYTLPKLVGVVDRVIDWLEEKFA